MLRLYSLVSTLIGKHLRLKKQQPLVENCGDLEDETTR